MCGNLGVEKHDENNGFVLFRLCVYFLTYSDLEYYSGVGSNRMLQGPVVKVLGVILAYY